MRYHMSNIDMLQATVEVFAEQLKIIIVVFNQKGYRIAATGNFKSKINEWGPENYPPLIAMKKRQRIVIDNPIQNEFCKDCIFPTVCEKKITLHIPIFLDNDVAGVISLLWYKKDDIKKYEYYINYLEKIIAHFLYLEKMSAKKCSPSLYSESVGSTSIKVLMNLIGQGVIIIDSNSCIREVNDQAIRITEDYKYSIIGKHINKVFEGFPEFGCRC